MVQYPMNQIIDMAGNSIDMNLAEYANMSHAEQCDFMKALALKQWNASTIDEKAEIVQNGMQSDLFGVVPYQEFKKFDTYGDLYQQLQADGCKLPMTEDEWIKHALCNGYSWQIKYLDMYDAMSQQMPIIAEEANLIDFNS